MAARDSGRDSARPTSANSSKTNPQPNRASASKPKADPKAAPKTAPKLVSRAKVEAAPAKKSSGNAPAKAAGKPVINAPSTSAKSVTKPARIDPARAAQFTQMPTLFGLEPDRVAHWLHERPIWVDELSGIGLVVAGLVLFLSQLNSSSSDVLANTLSYTLRTLVGQGGALVLSLMIMAAGLAIILSRLGIRLHLTIRRFIVIEAAFVIFLALLHLFTHDPEARAVAREGLGGGYIGWAVSALIAVPFGTTLATIFYILLELTILGVLFGVQRQHVRAVMGWLSVHLSEAITRLNDMTARLPQPIQPPPVDHSSVYSFTPTPYVADNYSDQYDSASEWENATVPQSFRQVPNPTPDTVAPVLNPPPRTQVPAAKPPRVDAGKVISVAPASKDGTKTDGLRPKAPLQTAPLRPVEQPVPPPELIQSASNPSKLVLRPPEVEAQKRTARRFRVNNYKEARQSLKRPATLPSLGLLNEVELNHPTDDEVNTNAEIIENTLAEFDIDVAVIDVKVGPTVTQYAVQPFRETTNAQGQVTTQRVRVNKIASLSGDLALALSAKRLRIQSYVPGHNYMGIEVPNRTPSLVALRPTLESKAFAQAYSRPDPEKPNATIESPLVFPLGRDVSGAPVIVNLATLPHLLIAGTTGSGKSVCLTAITLALTIMNGPDRLRLVMLDPKMVELTRFNGLPHLLGPVETDKERILGVLRWATREMDRRYKLLEVEAARNIDTYNRALGKRRKAEHLPYIVIVVDEIGDLMLNFPDETERTITRLAQMARAVGMHLIVTTQRPSVDIITGLIKANFPARISFAVTSGIDSRVILDTVGAESLVGRGDMLYLPPDVAEPQRVQGCYASDEELEKVMAYWKEQVDPSVAVPIAPWERGVTRRDALVEAEPLLENAIALVVREQSASPFMLQRHLAVDYPRAVRMMEMLQQLGVTGIMRSDGRTRDVIVKPDTDQYRMLLARKQ